MAPKNKDAPKKPQPTVNRPPISDSSLVYVPGDAIKGFQKRIETGIDWTTLEKGARHHRELCKREDIPTVTFSQAMQNKLSNSVINYFIEDNPKFNLQHKWEFLLPAILWDNEKFATSEGKTCFHNANCVTDDVVKLIKQTVKTGDPKKLKKDLKMVTVLRVNDTQMTELDEGLLEFKKLLSLNLCGNFIKHLDSSLIPQTVKSLELQANALSNVGEFSEYLPRDLLYLGLSKNFLTSGSLQGLALLPYSLTVLDISDNDICDLEEALRSIAILPSLAAVQMSGNPCSVCAAYARLTLMKLQRIKWLDCREVLSIDRPLEHVEVHPDDLRSTYFHFTVIRIISAPQPPKPEKGAITSFHVEFELPLLDVARRRFLLYRRNESLVELLPPPEDEDWAPGPVSSQARISKMIMDVIDEESSQDTNIFNHMVPKNPREIHNYTTFESNRVQWSKIMNFQEPILRLFCPDLVALRDTFRSTITVRLVYSIVYLPAKPTKGDRKSSHVIKLPTPGESRVVIAQVKLPLKAVDWSQPAQHFHWDDSLGTEDAIHWGDGDLSVIQYSHLPVKSPKTKQDGNEIASRQTPPENLTCHFSVGIESLR